MNFATCVLIIVRMIHFMRERTQEAMTLQMSSQHNHPVRIAITQFATKSYLYPRNEPS